MTTPAGLVVVDKPAGMTSHDVVGRIRRLAGTRKVGHAGTLDPMATGVLVVGIGRATRLLGHLMLTKKAYDATVLLGQTSSTDDAEGELGDPVDTGSVGEQAVRAAFARQVGEIAQVPTAVSAIKVDGKRAYQRVRDGESVELAARTVRIEELTVHEVRRVPRPVEAIEADISVRCSSGTYIRAIARDIGAELGIGGHLTSLRRTAVGAFGLDVAHTLDQLAEEFAVLPLAAAARSSFPAVDLDERQADDVRVGRRLALSIDGLSALFAPDGEFLALYEPAGESAAESAGGSAKPVAVFVG